MDMVGKKVLVVGLARSGLALVKKLLSEGAQVTITDVKSEKSLGEWAEQLPENVKKRLGDQPSKADGYDLIITSPGVPTDIPLFLDAKEKGVSVIGELEFGFQSAKAQFLGITGTNGKTTTTSLVGYFFELAGREHKVVGNIGEPVVDHVEEVSEEGWLICEVSSFQLETVVDFSPKIACILNITPDHLNRHKTMAAYVEAKSRIFTKQAYTDWVVLNYDDPYTRALGKIAPSNVLYFSRQTSLQNGVFLEGDQLVISENGERLELLCRDELALVGDHNLENALAAVAMAYLAKIPFRVIVKGLKNFQGVAHRIEKINTLCGVTYYNDSKATNPEAAMVALDAFTGPIHLLAGGMDKGSDFTVFAQRMKTKVVRAALIGETKDVLSQVIAEQSPETITETFDHLEDALEWLATGAKEGDIVLLSPACASWDMYPSYEHRGDHFRRKVGELSCNKNPWIGSSY